MKMKKEEAMAVAGKMRKNLKIQNAMGFADTNIKPPDIDFYPDDENYFNSGSHEIHLGVYGILDLFGCEDEEDFAEAMNYVRGHEEEHCRSTSHRPYSTGIQKGVEEVLKYISSQVDKTTRRFRTARDYEHFANNILPSMGIYINYTMLGELVSGIANSLEDGRIERIRSLRFPGFERLRVKYRGIFWRDAEIEFKDYDEIKDNPAICLEHITNTILTLATCQLYPKGFAMAYSGTPLMDVVKDLMPHIGRAYMAKRCKGMSVELIEISKKLAPYIYETCRMAEKDVEIARILRELIQSILKKMLESGDSPGGELSEADEVEAPDGMPKSTFPVSDLVIVLPDEEFDRLQEEAKDKSGCGNIMVKREHPKEKPEPEKQDKPEKNGSSGSGCDGQTEMNHDAGSADAGSEGAGSDKSGEAEKNEKAKKSEKKAGDEKEEAEETGSAGSGESSDEEYGSESSESGEGSSDSKTGAEGNEAGKSAEGADSKEEIKTSDAKSRDGSKGKGSGLGEGSDEEKILQAMEEAAASTREEAAELVSNINAHISHEKRTQKDTPDREPVLSSEEMSKAIDHGFVEKKRMYKVEDNLPPVLQARGRAMYRKNQRYFKSISRPTVRYMESGSVDPGRIYGLGIGDTEVFQKLGKDRQFDGCAYLLIDNSGSMSGDKRIEACKAGAVIEEGFRKMFPVKIVAFDSDGCVYHEVIKGWDEWLSKNCCWNFALHGREGYGNEDGYDIQIATRELLARPEKNKLLVILSDGAPSNRNLVNEAVRDARRKGIEVYSIYFEEGEPDSYAEEVMQNMYEKDFLICSLDELDSNLYKLFQKFSRR